MEVIWRRDEFFRPFIAPFVHHYFKSKVYIKPTLKTIESFFTVMRMSYANVRDELHAVLDEMPPGPAYNHARNLYAMMEFFIPLVTFTF